MKGLVTATVVAAGAAIAMAGGVIPAPGQTKLTPGTAALLIEQQDSAGLDVLRDGLADGDPAVRAVTARIAGLRSRAELADTLLDVLAPERDATAAREQARALLYLRGVDALPQVRAAAARHGRVVRAVLAEWLARVQPAEFASALPALLHDASGAEAGFLGSIAAMAVRQTPDEYDRIERTLLGGGSARAWREFLHPGFYPTTYEARSVTAGLASADAATREATIWFAVVALAPGRNGPAADVIAALTTPAGTTGTVDGEWAAFGQELLARRFRKSKPIDGSAVIERHGMTHQWDAPALNAAPELTRAERSAVAEVFPDLRPPPTSDAALRPVPRSGMKPGPLPMRTPRSLAPGFLASVFAATGCVPPPKGDQYGAARVAYRPDGRPRAVALDAAMTGPPECARFVKAVAALSPPQPDQPIVEGVPHWLFMKLDEPTIRCADSIDQVPGGPERPHGVNVTPLRLTRDVKPVFPRSGFGHDTRGAVILGAVISRSGCVADVEVLRSIEIPFDIAALQAVLQWRFSPHLLDGAPVEAVIAMTATFGVQ